MDNFLYFEVDAEDVLVEGKKFDALTVGTFTDMYGRRSTFRKKDLQKYVENTKSNIAASESDEGEVVGLPIDAAGHDKGDGAGWITDIELDGSRNVIRITPKWTEIGVELIKKKIRRFFSATIDISNKVVLGGTLTNWPAIRDKKGKVLLRPVNLEMYENLYEYTDESLDEKAKAVRDAFYDEYGFSFWDGPRVLEVFEDYIIIYQDTNNFKVTFEINEDDEYEFADEDNWIEVKRTWVEAMGDFFDEMRQKFVDSFPENNTPSPVSKEITGEDTNQTEVITMDLTKEELAEFVTKLVNESVTNTMDAKLAEFAQKPENENENEEGEKLPVDILEQLNLGHLGDEAEGAITDFLVGQFDKVQENAEREYLKVIANAKKESNVFSYVDKITGGTEEIPYGIPVEAGALKEWILSLDPDQAEFAQKMLEAVWRTGRTEFSEIGNAKDQEGSKELPDEVLEGLRSGEFKLKDLSDPILALGDVSQYDLSEFNNKE